MLSSEEQIRIQKIFDKLIKSGKKSLEERDINQIEKAYRLSLEAHKDIRRATGEPYILHSLAVAQIVLEEMRLDGVSAIGALLHNITQYTDISFTEVEKEFGSTISDIIRGLSKIEGLQTHKATLQADNFIRLLLNLSNDVRIILIKLADRLDKMRTLDIFSKLKQKQKEIANETLHLYAPIAHRLGLYNIKTELEELSVKYSESELYSSIERKLHETEADREKYINNFIRPIKTALAEHGYKFEIKGRVKGIFSVLKKMKKQQVEFHEVYDIFAIRVILESGTENEKDDCWKVYSLITDIYQPNPRRLRDWISSPKLSGYESLHTTVIGPQGKWVEIQIRTKRMDEVAEKGHAAHWKYKKEAVSDDSAAWLTKIREILEKPFPEKDKIDDAKKELYSDQIFVFTPQGDLKKLSANATVLDFAYTVHTEIGNTCVGAKVNGKIAPLKHCLTNGDEVEIMTAKNQKPKP
ncbi:MAG: bifunctional (p)ppGpp synthetase/guanosine-3',5'-bis(diphosphate) 3'-pyrophosphohydrolase, partial [Bacteroidia bacterium]|nr:bifunctional (p)ppGpp synthetase/guanosine-3',5'-bis(diphosphate) 3'-pyrophosphohydrolase [Bacteroidia bacterium]